MSTDTINSERLIGRLRELSSIGRREDSGVNRQAFTPEDGEARRLVVVWAEDAGLQSSIDAIGNLFIRFTPEGRVRAN